MLARPSLARRLVFSCFGVLAACSSASSGGSGNGDGGSPSASDDGGPSPSLDGSGTAPGDSGSSTSSDAGSSSSVDAGCGLMSYASFDCLWKIPACNAACTGLTGSIIRGEGSGIRTTSAHAAQLESCGDCVDGQLATECGPWRQSQGDSPVGALPTAPPAGQTFLFAFYSCEFTGYGGPLSLPESVCKPMSSLTGGCFDEAVHEVLTNFDGTGGSPAHDAGGD